MSLDPHLKHNGLPGWRRRLRRLLPWVMLWTLAFAVRAVCLGDLQQSPLGRVLMGDAERYDAWAREILAGEFWGQGVFYQAPLYPYFLAGVYAVFGPAVLAARAVQIVLGATACLLVAAAGRRLYSPATGWLAGGLLAIYPPAIFFDLIVQKTALATFLFCGLLWQAARIARQPAGCKPWAGIGATVGLLALVRENALVLAVVLPAWSAVALRRGRGGRRGRAGCRGWSAWLQWTACLWLAAAAVLFPVALRNRIVGGEWHLTTAQFGPNFYIGNHRGADGRYFPLRPIRGSPSFERRDATALAEQAAGRTLSPREVSRHWTRRALDDIATDPPGWLRLLAAKLLLTLNAVEIGDTEDVYALSEYSPLLRGLLAVFHFGVLFPLAAAGLWLTAGARRRDVLLVLLLAAYVGTVVLFYVFARYRHPLALMLVLPAAAALLHVPTLVRRHKRPRLVGAALAGAACALIAHWPLSDADAERSNTHRNLAVYLARDGAAPAEVESHLRRAAELNPDDARVERFWGQYLYARDRAAHAVPHFRRALDLLDATDTAPGDLARLHHNLGRALVRAGRPDRAIAAFEQAVALDADLVPSRLVLAGLLERAGRSDEALVHWREALRRLPPDAPTAASIRRLLDRRGTEK